MTEVFWFNVREYPKPMCLFDFECPGSLVEVQALRSVIQANFLSFRLDHEIGSTAVNYETYAG